MSVYDLYKRPEHGVRGLIFRVWTISRILNLSDKTVCKLMDDQTLPVHFDERGRYVTRSELALFMKLHGFWECTPAVSRYLLELEP